MTPTWKKSLTPSSSAHMTQRFWSHLLIASATTSAFFPLTSPDPIGSAIDPDWSIRKKMQVGFPRLISEVYFTTVALPRGAPEPVLA